MEKMMQDNSKRAVSGMMMALTAYYLFLVAYWVYAQMYYFADGAYFFVHLLETGNFLQLNPNRMNAHYATQFLPVMAIKILGIRDYALLSYLYGINLYLPQLVSLAICYSLVKKDNAFLMVFPLLSLFGVSMNGSLVAISQSHVMTSVFWPIIFYVTLKERVSLKDSFIFFALVLVFMKSYESALFLGPILAFISFQKIVRKGGAQKILWGVATTLFFASAMIALREILHPYDAGNRMNFIMSVFELHRHYPAVLSMCFMILIFISSFRPELLKRHFIPIACALFACMMLVSFSPIIYPHVIMPYLQYNARVMTAYVIPPMAIFLYLIVNNRISVPRDSWNRIGILVAILIFGQISWHLITASQWNGFRKVFKQELSQHSGRVSFQDSILSRNRVGKQLVGPFLWNWSVPTLSILWSNGGNVSTIITNNPEYRAWEPFDPARIENLPKIEPFGFSYMTYKEAIEMKRAYTISDCQ
ncbi:MAG: hypothetical protein V1766_00490 [Pseudomonadota bacterium]